MAETILLGQAPRPTDDAQLAEQIRAILVLEGATGIADGAVAAVLDGADVAILAVDLTGAAFGERPVADHAAIELQGAPVSREPGTLRELIVQAEPMLVGEAAVSFRLQLLDVRFDWVETDAGELGVAVEEPSDEQPLRGHVRVSLPKHQLGALALGLTRELLSDAGVTVSRLDVEVEASGPQGVRLLADAKVRKGLLSASVRGAATATLDDRMGVTLSGIRLESGNPIVSAMLAAARGHIRDYEGRRIDLVSELPAGIAVADVQVLVAEAVTVEARLV